MNSPGWKKSLSKMFARPLPRSAPRRSAAGARAESHLVIEPLESRDVPAIINFAVTPISPTEGVAFGTPAAPLPVATFQVDNYLGFDQSIQFSAAIMWGDGAASGGLGSTTIQFLSNDGAGRASYRVFGYHTYRHASNPAAPLDLDVEVFDNTGPGTTQTASTPITVLDRPLTATGVQPVVAATTGAPLVNVDVATFTDANPLALAGDYTATVTWGNPTQTTAGTVVRDTNGVFHVLASHTYNGTAPAAAAYTVTIVDVTASVTINSNAVVSQAPIVPTAAPVAVVEGGSIPAGTAVGTFTDLGGGQAAGAYTATANFPNATGPTGLTVVRNGSTNQYTLATTAATNFITPPLTGASNYALTVTAGTGPTAATTGALVVTNAALAVVSTTPPAAAAGQLLSNVPLLVFSDAFTTEPVGSFTASINWGDGTPASVGTVTALGGGQYQVRGSHTYLRAATGTVVTVHVADSGGASLTGATAAFAVADGPIAHTAGLPVFTAQGVPLADVPVATFTDANPFASAADYTATINWGDGTGAQPAQVRLVGGSAAGAVFGVYGSHLYATAGTFTTQYSVVDAGGAASIVNQNGGAATVTVGAIVVAAQPVAGTVNSPTAAGVIATFTDTGGADPVASYAATINWGDGSPTSAGTITALGGNQFSVSAPAHTYTRPGVFAVRVTVANAADSTSGVGGSTAAVANSSLAATAVATITTAVEGAPLTATLATFTDTDATRPASAYTATIDWGDGSPASAGTITGPVGGPFAVAGTHTYADPSATPRTVQVVVTDGFGGRAVASLSVVPVADAALSALPGVPVFASKNQPLNNVPVGRFTDANPGGSAADFTVLINWGDGSPATPGAVTLVGGSPAGAVFAVSGSHVYTSVPVVPYSISYSVTSVGGSTLLGAAGGSATVTQGAVQVVALPRVTTIGTAVPAGVVATFTDLTGPDPLAAYSATIDWGDGSPTSVGTIAPLGGNQFSVSGPAHTYPLPGSYVVTVTVVNNDPATGVGANLVVVQTAPITITPIGGGGGGGGGPIAAVEGTPLANVPVASFATGNPAAVAADFAAVIDWGDGSPFSTGTITGPAGGPFVVTGNHTYADESAAGFPVTVVVTDNYGGRASLRTTAVVADATLVSPQGIPQFATGGSPLSNAPLGTFRDNNPLSTPAEYTATINWGDGSPAELGFVTLIGGNATQSFFSVGGTHLYASAGVRTVVINVADEGGQTTTITTTVTVTGSALSLNSFPVLAVEGNPTAANLLVATFTDPGTGPGVTYQVTINWGDGTFSNNGSGVVVQPVAVGSTTFNVLAPPHTYLDEGSYVVSVTVVGSNGSGPSTSANLATVRDAALTGINGATITVVEGAPTGLVTVVSFTDGNPLAPATDHTATIDWGDGTTSPGIITQPGGVGTPFLVSGNHTYRVDGQYVITVQIQDEGGSRTSATALANVTEAGITVNATPLVIRGQQNATLASVDVATFASGNPFETAANFAASIVWGDGATTAGVIVVDAFGRFHVQGTHAYAVTGNFTPVVTITEVGSVGVLGQVQANVTIVATPLLVTAAPVQATEGVALPNAPNATNGTIVATFVDVFGADPLASYSAMIDWGNGQVTPGTIVAGVGPNFVVVAPAAPPIVYPNVGTFTVRVTVTNVDASQVTGFFQAVGVTTATVADAPLAADPVQPVVNGFQGTPLVGVPVSRFTDGNPTGSVTDFTATIDWGDGTPATAGTVTQPGGPGTPFVVLGNHTYANPTTPPATPYAVTVTVVDADGSRLTTRTTANITASVITGTPTVLNGVEGQPIVNGVVAYFTDSGIAGPVSSYAASINWGTGLPGSVTVGQIVPLGGNAFQVLGTYTYPRENVAPNTPYSVTVSISHNGLAATTVVSQANIADAPISGVAVPVFANEGVPFTGTVAVFTDTNPNGTAADFTATITWGDGSTSTGRVVRSGASYLVTGADPVSGVGHIYTREGTYPFSVTVRDGAPGGAEFTAFQTATVFDAPLTVTGINTTIVEGPLPAVPLPGVVAPTFNVATFTDAGNVPPGIVNPPSYYTATINWGDGAVTTGVIGNPTLLGGQLVYPVSGQHLYADVGVYHLTITVRTSGTSSTTTTAVITVTDAALTAGPATALTAVEGSSFTAQVATFSDADLLGRISDYSATIAWGDGTTSAGVIGQISTPLGSPPQFTVVGTHTYADPSAAGAPYAVAVTIRGVTGGNSTTAAATVAVGSAPLSSEGGTVHGVEGNSTGTVLIGTFTDADPQSALAEFTTGGGSITIDWGNGGGPVAVPTSAITAVGSPSGVTYRVSGAFTYPRPGTYPITVVVTDRFGASTVIQSVALIAAAPLLAAPAGTQPTIGTTEGSTYTGPVFRFTDGNPLSTPADFAATINWGDGTSDTGTVAQPGGAGTTYVVSGSHRYLDNGNYTVGVFVQKTGGGSSVNYTTTAVVTGVAPTAVITNTGPVAEGSAVTVALGDPRDPSPTDTLAGFRYSFATSAAGLAGSYAGAQPGGSASFTFPDGPSTQTVFGRVFDKDGLFTDYQTVVTVTNVNPTAALNVAGPFIPKKPFTVSFSNPFDPGSVDTTAGFRYQYDFGDGAGFGAPTASPTATFTPPRPGTYVVRGRIIDKDGGLTEYTANLPGNVVIPNVDVYAVGNGVTGGPIVKVYSSLDNSLVASFTAYEPTFRGGVLVATGDVTGDGIPDIITGTGVGGGPVVKVFDGVTFFEIASFLAYEESFRGGVFVAAGDTDGDGRAEIITGTGFGGGPVVKVFDGRTLAQRSSFAAYDISARGGVYVAAADTTGDGKAEVITGAGRGGGPHVKIFDAFGNQIRSFFAYDASFTGGVSVSAGDLYGLGYADIVTGTGFGGGPEVRVLDSQTGRQKDSFAAFGPDRITGQPLRNGFSVSATHVIGPTGRPAILAAAGPDYGPTVRLFDAVTHASLGEILPYEDSFTGGAYVG